jgi:hypothetical protein
MAKGLFRPLNPEKYLGNIEKIRFLSSWERHFMVMCDTNPSILRWGSEEFKIPYLNPIKSKICSYIPDFIIKYKDRDGNIITEVIEIKPSKEAMIRPKMSNYDKVAVVLNHAKWTAAKAFCDARGIRFRVVTENEMFRK